MIRKKRQRQGPIVVDLTGPEGNAYVLMGMAQDFCKQLGKDCGPIIEEMKSGDYEHLLQVFDREFGSFVILER